MNASALAGLAIMTTVLFAFSCIAEEAPSRKNYTTIVVFGDSTTATRGKLEIYANLLVRELPSMGVPSDIINAGVGGNSTQNAMARFEKDVLGKNPDIVVIQFGINDSVIDVWKTPPATKSRVSMENYIHNIGKFIDMLKARKCEVIIMTPNKMCWTPTLKSLYGKTPYMPDDPEGFNVALREYARALRELAENQKVPLVDVYAAFSNYGKVEKQSVNDLLLDGMHPNDKGHRIVADLLIPEIVKLKRKSTD